MLNSTKKNKEIKKTTEVLKTDPKHTIIKDNMILYFWYVNLSKLKFISYSGKISNKILGKKQ